MKRLIRWIRRKLWERWFRSLSEDEAKRYILSLPEIHPMCRCSLEPYIIDEDMIYTKQKESQVGTRKV